LVRVWNEGTGQIVNATPASGVDWDSVIAPLPKPVEGQSRVFWTAVNGQDYRCIWLRTAPEPSRNIFIAVTTKGLEGELHDLLVDLLWVGTGMVAIMAVLAVLLVHIGLRPIHWTARQLMGIDASNIADVELGARDVPSELTPFVESLGQMLRRLYEFVRRQKAFIADASHELRTPLTVAKSTVQTALAGVHSAEQYRQSLEETLTDLRRLEHLVDELLLLARIDDTIESPSAREVQIDRLLAELAEAFGPLVSRAGGRLTCSLSPSVVRGDYKQLGRLFTNLLDNALRHGPKEGTIELAAQAQDDQVAVSIRDDGGNIPPETIPRLFERFYRVDRSRNTSTGGAGLGLAIAREIVIRHGGTIKITSDPADGTRVVVMLPSCATPRQPE
jgi:two-component system heavy metal sensor histidine kinase CusS